jgi:hypothetical protein
MPRDRDRDELDNRQFTSARVKKKLDELLNSPPEKSRVSLISSEVQTELDKLENSPLVRKEPNNLENLPLPEYCSWTI